MANVGSIPTSVVWILPIVLGRVLTPGVKPVDVGNL